MLFLASALTLGLAACGGSSGRSAAGPVAEPVADETGVKAIGEAKDGLTAAQSALIAAMSSDATTDAELRTAYQAVATAADNLVMALKASAGTADDVEAAVEARENAESEVTRLTRAIADFLHFGHWMESTMKRDGTRSHVFRTFSGSEAAAYDGIGDVTGTASYAGAAAGRYVQKTLDPDGTASEVSDGSFTAYADLTATFGNTDGTVAAADQFSIKGEVSNFMDGGTDLGWTLELGKANLGDRDSATGEIAAANATSDFSGMTTGSAGARIGTWSGTLYGVDPEETGGVPVLHQPPTGVAGEFNGHFANGHVAGAFGASIDG